jgi:lipoprotein signal peptidase
MSFKFWGIFGMERWPTENFADISVVVSAALLALTTIVADARRKP